MSCLIKVVCLVVLCLGVSHAWAHRFDDLLAQATAAWDANDLDQANKLLLDAQQEIAKSASASAASGTNGSPPLASSAMTAGGATATPQPKKQEEERSVFMRLSDDGFRLQLGPGLSGDDAGNAEIAFAKDIEAGTDTEVMANFTLGFSEARRRILVLDPLTSEGAANAPTRAGASNFFGMPNTTWVWDASAQGQLTSQDNNNANAWTFRLGVDILHIGSKALDVAREATKRAKHAGKTLDLQERGALVQRELDQAEKPFYRSSIWSVKATLAADQDFANQRASVELDVTPNTSLLGNGRIWPAHNVKENAFMRVIWRPYFGVDVGGQIASDGTIDEVDDTLWLTGTLTTSIYLDFLQRALGLDRVSINVEDNAYYLTESQQGFNYLNATLDFGLTEYLGFGFTYINGELAPLFERTESFSGAFTVKF